MRQFNQVLRSQQIPNDPARQATDADALCKDVFDGF
ncbi:hypothetical protein ALP92_200101 [Pseudomonas syringae pv. primulae]|uniref:Uncharacterized protein n=1 Tax=Pseudomonas syringae pv. primulae TaxID=251707 RepID=A0A3M4RRJ1_9PSED|nr:hypothetical protein ALP92_200101 [Pseudomonas syringae pv. primulae]